MTWFGGPEYLLALAAVVVIALLIDWWLLHTGQVVRYKGVSHHKLRAVGRMQGAFQRPGTEASLRGAPGEPPRPAPGHPKPLPGAGPQPQTAVDAPLPPRASNPSSGGL